MPCKHKFDRPACPFYEHKASTWNEGDWTTLDTVEIGDIVGGVKIENDHQIKILKNAHFHITKR